jgi:hypothetical protein
MGIACSVGIFQDKMSELMQHLECVHTYLYDVLRISTSIFEDQIQKTEIVFKKLSDHGLRVNTEKSKLCPIEIEYLG